MNARNALGESLGRLDRQRTLEASQETLRFLNWYLASFPELDTSSFYLDPPELPPLEGQQKRPKLRVAILQDSEILDWATAWQSAAFTYSRGLFHDQHMASPPKTPPLSINCSIAAGGGTYRVLVINAAHSEKPGGDWIQCMGTQEDTICRRSTLAHSLNTPHCDQRLENNSFYPLDVGGVYSPNVVVFRQGPAEDYEFLPPEGCNVVSVASVAPERTPLLSSDGTYAFEMEEKLQRKKMQTALRIAALNGHVNLVISMFGSVNREVVESPRRRADSSPPSRRNINPIKEVARLWQELLESDGEFDGYFENVVFVLGIGPKASEEAAALTHYFGLPRVNDLLKEWFPGAYDFLDAHVHQQ